MRWFLVGTGLVVLLVCAASLGLAETTGVRGWLAVLVGLIVLAALTYAAPVVLGVLAGLFQGLAPQPGADAAEHLGELNLNEVRARAGEFERRGRSRRQGGEKKAWVYEVPAHFWRRLEREMRDVGAWTVSDLGDAAVEAWVRRLNLDREDRRWPSEHHQGPPEATAQVRVVEPSPWEGGHEPLRVRRHPNPPGRRGSGCSVKRTKRD